MRSSVGAASTIILPSLLDTIDTFCCKYNTFLLKNRYGPKYDIGDARMFVIEGIAKVRKGQENRKRKLTKHKKLPNNTIIEIDHCSPLEILKLQRNLIQIAEGEGIGFVYGKSLNPKSEALRGGTGRMRDPPDGI